MSKLPANCPSCGGGLSVKRLSCSVCSTDVEGLFPLPSVTSLTEEEQDFIMRFITASGSLKAMAKHLRVSYPTVRNRLNEIIMKLKTIEREKGRSK